MSADGRRAEGRLRLAHAFLTEARRLIRSTPEWTALLSVAQREDYFVAALDCIAKASKEAAEALAHLNKLRRADRR